MSLNKVPAGKDLPEEINVIIEIPAHADPVKYEVDKDSGALFVDRFMSTCMHYPTNYGYVPHTLSDDGDPARLRVARGHGDDGGKLAAPRIGGEVNHVDGWRQTGVDVDQEISVR